MSGAPCPPAWPSKAEEGLKVRSLCGWLLEAAGGGCRDCWVGGPLWCNGCPDWLLGWGTCKPCCMEVWDWSVLPGWGICGGGKKQEKKVRPQGTVLAVPDSVTACYKTNKLKNDTHNKKTPTKPINKQQQKKRNKKAPLENSISQCWRKCFSFLKVFCKGKKHWTCAVGLLPCNVENCIWRCKTMHH